MTEKVYRACEKSLPESLLSVGKTNRIRIAIGSNNPVKVKATVNVMRKIYSNVEIVSVDVRTNVSHTPLSDEECIKGALQRAKDAIELTKADLGVGMEGGIVKRLDRYFLTGWCVVIDKYGELAMGHGGGIELPKKLWKRFWRGKN